MPSPIRCLEQAQKNGLVNEIVKIAGLSLNMALETAANEVQPQNRVYSPQNWIKAKTCLAGIDFAIKNYFQRLPIMPVGTKLSQKLIEGLVLGQEDFEYKWAAD